MTITGPLNRYRQALAGRAPASSVRYDPNLCPDRREDPAHDRQMPGPRIYHPHHHVSPTATPRPEILQLLSGVADQLAADHAPGSDGYCTARTCSAGHRWPCESASLAQAVKVIPAQRKATP